METSIISAGIVSSIIGLLGLMISKENKVSEFRQKWIDELRNEISSTLSYSSAIIATAYEICRYETSNIEPEKLDKQKEKLRNYLLEFNQLMTRIKLRTNKNNLNDSEFLDAINKFDNCVETLFYKIENHDIQDLKGDNDHFVLGTSQIYKNFQEVEKKLLETSNKLLKIEWERVKNGEPVFNFVLSICASFLFFVTISYILGQMSGYIVGVFVFLIFLTRQSSFLCFKRGIKKLIPFIPSWLKKCPFIR
jgi:uncharacterized protein YaaR (DUF327 family)